MNSVAQFSFSLFTQAKILANRMVSPTVGRRRFPALLTRGLSPGRLVTDPIKFTIGISHHSSQTDSLSAEGISPSKACASLQLSAFQEAACHYCDPAVLRLPSERSRAKLLSPPPRVRPPWATALPSVLLWILATPGR